eukprot:1158947-Pelagomonas_calceolata.AAC.8
MKVGIWVEPAARTLLREQRHSALLRARSYSPACAAGMTMTHIALQTNSTSSAHRTPCLEQRSLSCRRNGGILLCKLQEDLVHGLVEVLSQEVAPESEERVHLLGLADACAPDKQQGVVPALSFICHPSQEPNSMHAAGFKCSCTAAPQAWRALTIGATLA